MQIQNSNIGIAVKDKSIAYIDPTSISNIGLDTIGINDGVYMRYPDWFAVYQKKPDLGRRDSHW